MHVWKNWAGTLAATPALDLAPRDLDGVVAAVRAARERGLTVRVVGTGHSLSPLVPPGAGGEAAGCLIRTTHLTRLLRVGATDLEVEAGAHLSALEEAAWELGLSVVGAPNFGAQTVGGVVATGAHGSSPGGSLANQIVAATIVRADGEVVRVTEADLATLRAVRVNLGMLGVVVALTVRCEPAFHMRVQRFTEPMETALAHLPERMATSDHLSLYWYPERKDLQYYTAQRVPHVGPTRVGPWRRRLRGMGQEFLNVQLGRPLFAAVKRVPALTGPLIGLGTLLSGPIDGEVRRSVDAQHYLWGVPPFIDHGVFVDAEHAASAYRAAFALLAEHRRAGRHPINMAAQLRVVGADDAYLSATQGRPSVAIEYVTAPGTRDADAFYAEFEALMRREFGGRPHWAKRFDPADLVLDTARVQAFETVRSAFDPERRFVNPLCQEILNRGLDRGPDRRLDRGLEA